MFEPANILPDARRIFNSQLSKNLSKYGLSSAFSQFFLLLYSFVVANALGPTKFGLLSANYAISGLTVFSVSWGIDTWILRKGGIENNRRELTAFGVQTKILLGFFWVISLISICPVLKPSLYHRNLLFFTAIDTLTDSILITLLIGLNLIKSTNQASLILIFTRFCRLILVLALIMFDISNELIFAIGRAHITIFGVIIALAVLRPKFSFSFISKAKSNAKELVVYGVPDLLSIIYTQVDVTIIGFLLGRIAVGLYFPAVSLINSIFALYNALYSLLVPRLTTLLQENSPLLLRFMIRLFSLYLVIGLFFGLGIYIGIKPLIHMVLGTEYAVSSNLIRIMSPILIFKSISFGCATYIVAAGLQSKRIWPQFLSASINILLNVILIPIYGTIIAAVSYVISEFILMCGYLLITYCHLKNENSL